jgi:integrase
LTLCHFLCHCYGMKARAIPSKRSSRKTARHEGPRYQKVFDGRKQPIRGLWIRGDRFYARLAVEDPNTGKKSMLRVGLDGVKTAAQAVDELRRLKTKREDRTLPALRQAPKLVDYVAGYFEYHRQVKDAKRPATIQKERGALALWVEHMGEIRLHHINRAKINAFIAKRQAKSISGRTVNLDVIALRNVLKRAIDDGWIKSLPTENLRPLKWTATKRELVSSADLEAFCAAALKASENGQELVDYIRLMAYSGARRNETLRLKWSDVDFDKGQLTIGSDGLTKNHEMRVVDFNASLETHLRSMHQRRAPDSSYLFPSPQRGDRDIPAKTLRDSLELARDASRIPLQFHDCRHHFISMAVMSGIDYMTIARWVGHKDGGVLIGKVYGHLSNEHAQRQAQKLVFTPILIAK